MDISNNVIIIIIETITKASVYILRSRFSSQLHSVKRNQKPMLVLEPWRKKHCHQCERLLLWELSLGLWPNTQNVWLRLNESGWKRVLSWDLEWVFCGWSYSPRTAYPSGMVRHLFVIRWPVVKSHCATTAGPFWRYVVRQCFSMVCK